VTGLATQTTGYVYQRGPTGNLTSATELSGRTVNWSYDGIYRLTNETISLAPSKNNGSVSYGLDSVGNRQSENSSLSGVPSPVGATMPTMSYRAKRTTRTAT
jgi:YD repeat-containing protein